jgi:hypothetical protein
MRPMLGYLFAVAAMAATIPGAARAQDTTTHAQDTTALGRRQAALQIDYTFTIPVGEPMRIYLAKGVRYRAEVQGTGFQLQLRPMLSSVQAPRIDPILDNRAGSASGEALYTIIPRADAEYQFITSGGQAGYAVKLRVYAMAAKDSAKS